MPLAIPALGCLRSSSSRSGAIWSNSRRLAASEAKAALVLDRLPADRWLVERYVLITSHRVPFLILGETGVFVLWAMAGPLQWRDLSFDEVARYVEKALPGYDGTVHRASVACPSPTSSRGGGAVPGSRAGGSWGSTG